MKTEEQIFNEYMKVNYPFINQIKEKKEFHKNAITGTYHYQAYVFKVRVFELLDKICSLFIK